MILHKPELIKAYTDQGYWGTRTLLERFDDNCARFPEREAIVDPPDRPELVGTQPRRVSWGELEKAVAATAAALTV